MIRWWDCFFGHYWTKWGDIEAFVRTVTIIASGDKRSATCNCQRRYCVKCGKVQTREVLSR